MLKNILFVDDNENLTSAIRRLMRPYRHQWQTFFVGSGAEALELLAKQEIDLIVTDLMMPEMRGDELLKIVAKEYPSTVRMILSGYANEETLKNSLEVAHQYLTKPCEPEILCESIGQIFKIQDCINNPLIIAKIGDIAHLPSLPRIYSELNNAVANEQTSATTIAEIFAKDIALSAKLLQLVNSPFFGIKRKISSLPEAVNLIGIKKIISLVLNVHIAESFPVKDQHALQLMEYLWQDATRTAELARLISLEEGQQEDRPDQAYLAGLLHNMGLLIFLSFDNDKGLLSRFIEQVNQSDKTVTDIEHDIFGFNRFEVAAYVLSLWKFPNRVIEAILLQQNPNTTDYGGMNALTAVHVAACLLNSANNSKEIRLFEMKLDDEYLKRISKQDRLPVWQTLADKVLRQYAK